MNVGLEHIHETLAVSIPARFDESNPDEDTRPDGSVLVAWVVIVEWMTPDGQRFIQRVGPEEQSQTMGTGLLYEGLDL